MINITIEIDGEAKQISVEKARELQKQLNELFGTVERVKLPELEPHPYYESFKTQPLIPGKFFLTDTSAPAAEDLTEAFQTDYRITLGVGNW